MDDSEMTFSGFLDDCVERAPFGAAPAGSQETAEETLLRHAIFGRPVLIHSGFLLNNSELRRSIVNRPSLLEALIKNNRIRILSRTGDLLRDEKEKIADGVITSIITPPTERIEIYDAVSRIIDRAQSQQIIVTSGDKAYIDASICRIKLMNRTLDSVSQPHRSGLSWEETEFEQFRQRYYFWASRVSPRSAWQTAVKESLEIQDFRASLKARQMMAWANEIFHYATVSCLPDEIRSLVYNETHLSPFTHSFMPYEKNYNTSQISRNFSDIRIPISPIAQDPLSFFDKLYGADHVALRNDYLADINNEDYARAYERSIYDILGLDRSYSETEKASTESLDAFITVGGAGLGAVAGCAIQRLKNNEAITRRFTLSEVLKAMFVGISGAVAGNALNAVAGRVAFDQLKGWFLSREYGEAFNGGEVRDIYPWRAGDIQDHVFHNPPPLITDMKPVKTL